MQPSSTFCRTQEAHQQALAAGAQLANVRGIATLAAAAWAKEALAADKREQRMENRKAIAAGLAMGAAEDRSFSENPDRGFATA